MPFKSKAQRAYLYANDPAVAREFQAHTTKGAKLPGHVASDSREKTDARPLDSEDKGGRPTKVSRGLAEQIASLIMGGMTEEAAAEQAGIDAATFFNWMKWGRTRPEFNEFYQVVNAAKAKRVAHSGLGR